MSKLISKLPTLSRNPEKYLKAILRTKFKKTQGNPLYHSLKIAALSVVNRDIGNSLLCPFVIVLESIASLQ